MLRTYNTKPTRAVREMRRFFDGSGMGEHIQWESYRVLGVLRDACSHMESGQSSGSQIIPTIRSSLHFFGSGASTVHRTMGSAHRRHPD